MDKIKQRPNLGYLVAGIGALVALLAILLLPYAIVTANASGTAFGVSVNESSTLTLNATAIAQNLSAIFSPSSNSPQVQNQGAIWLLPILALVALVLTGLVLFRDHPFGKGIKAPLAMQKRWGNYGLIGAAALSVLIQIVLFSNLSSQIQNAFNASRSSSGSSPSPITANVSTGTHAGFWLFLLGMAAAAAGAILLLVQESKQTQAAQAVSNMSGGQPYQPYPPQQVQPYPPQQQDPYPPQQVQPYPPQQQDPYPPQQAQPYSSQQWPPSSNQPPYPPGQ